MPKKLPPVHPGEILREEFIGPLALNANKLALDLHVPPPRVYEIINERRGITSDTALRLAHYFNTTPEFWMNLQTSYDLAMTQDKEQARIEREVRPMTAASARRV